MTEHLVVRPDASPSPSTFAAERWSPWEVVPLGLEHRGLFERYLEIVGASLSDYSFAGNACWRSHQELYVTVVERCLCLLAVRDGEVYMPLPPLGEPADQAAAAAACVVLMERCNGGAEAGTIHYATGAFVDALRAWGAPWLTERLTDARVEGVDFIYNTADLVELRGADYKSKRSDINQLLRAHPSAVVEPLVAADVDAVRELCLLWLRQRGRDADGRPAILYGVEEEVHAILYAAQNLDALGLVGARLRIEDRMVGFTIGERLVTGCANVLFEKTDLTIPGASQLLFREFCRSLQECPRITTGDGVGSDSLIRAKMSYRPVELAEKLKLTFARGSR